MNKILRNALAVAGVLVATQATAELTFYEREDFAGRSFSTETQIGDFKRVGFNDRASSVVVTHDRWDVCEDTGFGGRCVTLRPGRYSSLSGMGLNNQISSVRNADREAPAVVKHDYRIRRNERLFQAYITSVHAVVGPPERRCWVEHQQVVKGRSNTNIPAAVAGALLGGVLGHQIGNGRGQDLATVGGAVAGGAVGANIGRDSAEPQVHTRDVQHCTDVPSQAGAEYWDVTYTFRGQEHRVQMSSPPGRTVTVNRQGEPRV